MTGRVITLRENVDRTWTAKDESEKITIRADTRAAALSTLDDIVDAIDDDGGGGLTNEKLAEVSVNYEEKRTLDELDFGGSAPDGRWPSTNE